MDPLLEAVELPYPDYPAHTYSFDRTGQRAVLAVQRLLAVIDLGGNSQKAFRKLNTRGRHDIKAVEWNPHSAKTNVLASASHNQVDVWNLELEQAGSLQCTLKAHTKPVYDLNWSLFDENLCATCSADSYVYVWDLRDYRRPKYGFKAVAGASIVQWNRMNAQVLASVHDSDVRIWDIRQPSSAVGFITAHLGKVHCIDWSYQEENKMVTCSQDATIKVWDTQDNQHSRTPLNTVKPWPHPVWRALFTPFGRGIVSVCAPTVHGSDPRILLWSSYEDFSAPLHVFTGGQETPNEVKWIPSANEGSPDSTYRLSSWSKIEKKLRIWTVPLEVEKACSAEGSIEASIQSALSKESPSTTAGQPTSGGGQNSELVPIPSRGGSGGFPSPGTPSSRSFALSHAVTTLEGEFASVDANIPNLVVEKRDPSQRLFRVKCTRSDKVVTLDITFPAYYPNNAPPFFIIDGTGTNLDTARQQSLLQSLTEVAQSSVKDNQPCLEPCLKKLSSAMQAIEKMADTAKMGGYPSPMNQFKGKDNFLSFADDSTPFPRTSGGRFCGNGLLVTFLRPPNLVLMRGDKMPRSMSSMYSSRPLRQSSAARSTSGPQTGLASTSPGMVNFFPALGGGGAGGGAGRAQQYSSILPYKVKDKPLRATSGGQGGISRTQPTTAPQLSNPFVGEVALHNATALLPFSPELAKSYVLTAKSVVDFCLDNKSVVAMHNRPDLVQAWSLALHVADSDTIPPPNLPEDGMPWSAHPMARSLVESLLNHYWKVYDIQTVALLSCVFHMYDKKARLAMTEQGVQHLTSPRTQSFKALSSGSRNAAATPTPTLQSPLMDKLQTWRLPAMQNWYHTQDMTTFDNYNDEPEDLGFDERAEHWQNSLLLDKPLSQRCYEARRCYGNILARWQLLIQRVEVLKFQMSKEPDHHYGLEFSNRCQYCASTIRGPKCHCQHMAFSCVVCNIAVRGLSNFCLSCGHGGHALHLQQWFMKHTTCPTGCGCRCLDSSLQMI